MILYLVAGAVALAVLAAAHWYLWKRLVSDVSRPGGWWRRVGTVLAVLLALLVPGVLIGTRVLSPTGAGQFLAWPGYLWLALLMYLLIVLAVLEVPRALGRRAIRRTPTAQPEPPHVPDQQTAPPVPDDAWRANASSSGGPADPGNPAGVGGPSGQSGPADPVGPADPAGTGDGAEAADGSEAAWDTRAIEPEPAGTPIDPARRLFLARSLALVAGAAAAGTVGYGVVNEMAGPIVRRVEVPLGRLDPQIDGFRIAVVSDLHLGPILHRDFTERVVSTINGQQPDLIAIVGDLVDGSVAQLGRSAEPLRRLSAPHGAYFVTGNHEYFSGVTQWVDEVRNLGVHPLRNQHTEIIGGRTSAFDLAGVNDATGGSYSAAEAPDYTAALRHRDPARPVVLLAHQPVQVHEAARRGVDLQLSGHTHGGQLWPFQYAVRLQQPVVSGLARVGRTWLYVTSGVGAWGPPVRVGSRSDVTMVTLRSTR